MPTDPLSDRIANLAANLFGDADLESELDELDRRLCAALSNIRAAKAVLACSESTTQVASPMRVRTLDDSEGRCQISGCSDEPRGRCLGFELGSFRARLCALHASTLLEELQILLDVS